MAYKSYGYIRIFVYALGFVAGAFGGGILLLLLPRFVPMLRLLGRFLWLDAALLGLIGILAAFWLANRFLIIPFVTTVNRAGFAVNPPFRSELEINVTWPEIETILELGFGSYVTARSDTGRYYRFLFGKDTDGYYRMMDTIRSGRQEFRYRTWNNR